MVLTGIHKGYLNKSLFSWGYALDYLKTEWSNLWCWEGTQDNSWLTASAGHKNNCFFFFLIRLGICQPKKLQYLTKSQTWEAKDTESKDYPFFRQDHFYLPSGNIWALCCLRFRLAGFQDVSLSTEPWLCIPEFFSPSQWQRQIQKDLSNIFRQENKRVGNDHTPLISSFLSEFSI